MKNEHTEPAVKWFPLKNRNFVAKIKDKEPVDAGGISNKVISPPCHLVSFILSLSHSKRLKNDLLMALDGFKNKKLYYGGTDSVYIHNDDLLKTNVQLGRISINQQMIIMKEEIWMDCF